VSDLCWRRTENFCASYDYGLTARPVVLAKNVRARGRHMLPP
jgi:hypothetical protein